MIYYTVAKGRCSGGITADRPFNFTIIDRSPALTGNSSSDYHLILYQTISEHREQGLNFDAVAEWLNKEANLIVRGKRFKGAHVRSILKKRLAKKRRIAEPRVSTSLVRLQYGSSR